MAGHEPGRDGADADAVGGASSKAFGVLLRAQALIDSRGASDASDSSGATLSRHSSNVAATRRRVVVVG